MARLILNRPEVIRTAQKRGVELVGRVTRMASGIARRTAPKGQISLSAPTGARLRGSIYNDAPNASAGLVRGKIGSKLKYAATVSLGSRPHWIRARRKKTLKFYWNRVGHVVYPTEVFHPGRRRPNQYMQRAMKVAALANGFRYRSRVK
jgi:hypothetical protein